jgi:hypothetical protein
VGVFYQLRYNENMTRSPLVLVLQDLWFFITKELWTGFSQLPAQPMLLNEMPSQALEYEPISSTKSVIPVPALEKVEPTRTYTYFGIQPTVQYVSVAQTGLYVQPYVGFDTLIKYLYYGDALVVSGYQGQYASVLQGQDEGWIHKDALADSASVWPRLEDQCVYTNDNPEVKKIRLLLKDTFQAGSLKLPLQAGEWVLYCLREQQRTIAWPHTYGREPGTWRLLLRGVRGIHSTIVPKSDTIMEWFADDGVGRLAYVERVSPELSITISVVGLMESGMFETKIFTESEWRELRPVFIEVQ